MIRHFTLWLEFEQYAQPYPGPDDDPTCDLCNVQVSIGAREYALNVWTFAFVEHVRRTGEDGRPLAEPASWLLPPDLLVARLERVLIEQAIEALLPDGLPEHCRVDQAG